MHFDCLNCKERINLVIANTDGNVDIEKLVYERNKKVTKALIDLKKKYYELKKRLEDALHKPV